MTQVRIKLETKIVQEHGQENFLFEEDASLTAENNVQVLNYFENEQIPVELRFTDKRVELVRGVRPDNYSQMVFEDGNREKATYVVDQNLMDFEVQTNALTINLIDETTGEIFIDYDLYTGVSLVGNYIFKLQFGR